MQQLIIEPKFKTLLPPLSPDEKQKLEQSILSEGCRDAIIVWAGNSVIVDGHNRYEICQRHNIEYAIIEKHFDNSDDIILWIITNQIGRRNLTDATRIEIALKLKPVIAAKAKERQVSTLKIGNSPVVPNLAQREDTGKTDDVIAEIAGVGRVTLQKAEKVFANGDDDTKDKMRSGELSIHAAYKETAKNEANQERQRIRNQLAQNGESIQTSDKWHIYHGDIQTWEAPRQYDFIITDPPYPKEYLPLWSVLSKRVTEWLKPGGLLIAMSGQSYLDEIHAMLGEHLQYYWTAAYLTPGQPTPLRQRNINTTWKPLLLYTAGNYTGKIIGDVFSSDNNDKDFHKWGQSVSGMYDIVSKICLKGQYILDPFCGAGTTGLAAIQHGCFFDGLDIDIQNVNISKGRLSNG